MRQTTKSINPKRKLGPPPPHPPPFSKTGLSDEMPVIVISWAGCSISSKFLALDFRHCAPNGWGSAKVCLTHLGSPGLFSQIGFSILSLLPGKMHHSYATRATTTCELRVYASAPLLFLSPALCCILLRFRHMQGGLSFNRTASFTLHFVFVFFSLLSKLCCMLRTQPANGIT
ncbi:hypothetical protein J3E68DRAFT_416300 [Trichoderma sp. SZMC 28012]